MLPRQKEKKTRTDEEKENKGSSKHIPVQNILQSGDFVHLILTWHKQKWCTPEHYWTKPKGIRRKLHFANYKFLTHFSGGILEGKGIITQMPTLCTTNTGIRV